MLILQINLGALQRGEGVEQEGRIDHEGGNHGLG